jgi:hypothetical protein
MPILTWKPIGFIVLILLAFGAGYYKSYASQKEKFEAFKVQTQINAKIQQDKNEILVNKQIEVSENITKEYANAVKKLNAYYATHPRRVYINTTSSGVSEVTAATTEADGEAQSDIPDTTRDATVDCASDVLQLLYLQEWLKEQYLVE